MKKAWFLVLLALSTQVVFAQTPVDEKVIVSPARVEKELRPGESAHINLKITNNKTLEKRFFVRLSEFGASEDESGSPTFTDRPVSAHSAFAWFKFPTPSIIIPAGERREVGIDIEVPQNAESGGYYHAIILSEDDPVERGSGPTVGVTQEIGTLVLIKIPGLIRESGKVVEMIPQKTIFWSQPIKIQTRFENTGNIHIKPTGLIEIFNMFGQKEEVLQVNSSFGNVLPGTIRRYENDWSPSKMFFVLPRIGRYEVRGLMTYGTPSVIQKIDPFYFWLIPYKFVLAVLGTIVGFSVLMYTLLKVYKRHVISQYHRR